MPTTLEVVARVPGTRIRDVCASAQTTLKAGDIVVIRALAIACSIFALAHRQLLPPTVGNGQRSKS
jgi:hypothetical protein